MGECFVHQAQQLGVVELFKADLPKQLQQCVCSCAVQRLTGLGVKAGHKPGSVHATTEVGLQRVGGYLSGTAVSDGLERRIQAERGRWPAIVPRPCSQPGFTEPAPLDAAGALLPHLCTLACAGGTGHRRCVSVALSSRSPALGITQQAWPSGSPDFPQPMTAARRQRPSIAITSPTFNPHNGL